MWKKDDATWSVLECIEHLAITEIGILRLLTRLPAAGSEVVEGTELLGKKRIDDALRDRTRRYAAPDFAAPRGRYANSETALGALVENRERMAGLIRSGGIQFDAGTRPHPLMGEMTKTDWFHFLLAHAERHRKQMEELLETTRL